jgi:hypothetical protein
MGTWGVPSPPVQLNITTPQSDSRVTYALNRMNELEESVQSVEERTQPLNAEMEDCKARVAAVETRETFDPRFPGLQELVVYVREELSARIGAEHDATVSYFLQVSDWQSSVGKWQDSTAAMLVDLSEWRSETNSRTSSNEGRIAGLGVQLNTLEEQHRAARFSLERSIRLAEDRAKAHSDQLGERVFERIAEVSANVGTVYDIELPAVRQAIGNVARQVVDIEKSVIPDAVDFIHAELSAQCENLASEIVTIKHELAMTWRQRLVRWWRRRFHART